MKQSRAYQAYAKTPDQAVQRFMRAIAPNLYPAVPIFPSAIFGDPKSQKDQNNDADYDIPASVQSLVQVGFYLFIYFAFVEKFGQQNEEEKTNKRMSDFLSDELNDHVLLRCFVK